MTRSDIPSATYSSDLHENCGASAKPTKKPTKWKDLKHRSPPKVRAKLKKKAHAELERLGFYELRQARQQTQVAVAEKLKVGQGAISRLEKQSDFLLSTLREYVEALGGQLELRVVFPDGDFVIETLVPGAAGKESGRPGRNEPRTPMMEESARKR